MTERWIEEVSDITDKAWKKAAPLNEVRNIVNQGWDTSRAVQPANYSDQSRACLAAEDIVEMLTEHPGPGQILDKVYLDRQKHPLLPRHPISIGVFAVREGVGRLLGVEDVGCIASISFETHPEWQMEGAGDFRWLKIQEIDLETNKLWETKYTFCGLSINKAERVYDGICWRLEDERLPLEDIEIKLINQILMGIRDKVGNALMKTSRE